MSIKVASMTENRGPNTSPPVAKGSSNIKGRTYSVAAPTASTTNKANEVVSSRLKPSQPSGKQTEKSVILFSLVEILENLSKRDALPTEEYKMALQILSDIKDPKLKLELPDNHIAQFRKLIGEKHENHIRLQVK